MMEFDLPRMWTAHIEGFDWDENLNRYQVIIIGESKIPSMFVTSEHRHAFLDAIRDGLRRYLVDVEESK